METEPGHCEQQRAMMREAKSRFKLSRFPVSLLVSSCSCLCVAEVRRVSSRRGIEPNTMSDEKTQAPSHSIPPEHCWTAAACALLATKRSASPRAAERTAWLKAVAAALSIASIELLPEAVTEEDAANFPALPADKHAELLQILVLASLHIAGKPTDSAYTALSRSLVFETARLLRLETKEVYAAEHAVAQQLYALLEKSDSSQTLSSASSKSVDSARKGNSALKWAATGAGFVLGGVAIGLSAGLAARSSHSSFITDVQL